MTPDAIIQRVLEPLNSFECGRLARQLTVSAEAVRKARNGSKSRPTHTFIHIAVCGWFGVDPVTGEAAPEGQRRLRFDAGQFSVAVRMCIHAKKQTGAQAAKAMKLSKSTLSRMENGDPRSFESVMAACRYGELNVHNYIVPAVAREATPGNAKQVAA